MKMLLTVLMFCLPAFGQAVYSGRGSYVGPGAYLASNNCASPHYCAYNGVDVIPAGSPPLLYNPDGTNNGATVYDTTFLGHKNFDGSIFSDSVLLSAVTRLTDENSSPQTCDAYYAGADGASELNLTNTNTSLVGVGCNGAERVGLFNTGGPNKGQFTPVHSGELFITTDMNIAGGGSSTNPMNFGSILFSFTDPATLFSFGGSGQTTVCPYTINYAANTPLAGHPAGTFQLDTCIVDFKYGLPQYFAPNWASSTTYHWGDYIIHPLSTSEMATSGAWTTGHTYAAGDIVVAQGGATACAYTVSIAGGVATSGVSPLFIGGAGAPAAPCKNTPLTDAAGNTWRGLSSLAQFVYQNTATACSAGCNSGSSFAISGHPDLLSTVTDGAATWTNVGPAYVPVTGNSFWSGIENISNDSTYTAGINCTVGVDCYPSKYAQAISTNTYGCSTGACSSVGYNHYNASQNTGKDIVLYDATANIFHHLDTVTGIWVEVACGTGNGYTCGNLTVTPVGTGPLTTLSCPYMIHDAQMNRLASAPYMQVSQGGGYLGSGCPGQSFQVWNANPSAFNATTSLQTTYAGLNHSTMDQTVLYAFSGTASGGANNGWFDTIYTLSAGVGNPSSVATSVYMAPSASPPASPYPLDCNTNAGTNPTCNLGATFDGHESCAGGCDHGSFHSCGTLYNSAFTSAIANAWQNVEVCFPTSNLQASPSSTFGPISQFTHDFNMHTSSVFNVKIGSSEWSQDGNWLFWTSDWGCNLGVVSAASTPAVWSSGSYYQKLIVAAVPASPISLCGYPWQPGTSYATGNLFTPIEGNGPDDVFQVIQGGTSGANSSIASAQPVCLQYSGGTSGHPLSCFAGTNPPSVTALTVTAATESGTTGTFTVTSGIQLNAGELVTLAGFTWSGGAGDGTFAVTGTVGANCPGTACANVTTIQLAGMPSGLGIASTLGTAASQGDTVCDSPSDNGSGSVNSFNPSSCPGGVLSQDLGPQNQRGDVFAVNLGNQR